MNKLNKKKSQKIPVQFLCPISQTVMIDPVVAKDGHTYQRRNIQQWLSIKSTSPLTNLRISNKELVNNTALRSLIQNYVPQSDQIQYYHNQKPNRNHQIYQQDGIGSTYQLLMKQKVNSSQFQRNTIRRFNAIQTDIQNNKIDVFGFRKRIRMELDKDMDVKWNKKSHNLILLSLVLFAITFGFLKYSLNEQKLQISQLKQYIAQSKANLAKTNRKINKINNSLSTKSNRQKVKDQSKIIVQAFTQQPFEQLALQEIIIFQDTQEERPSNGSFLDSFNHLFRFASVFAIGGLIIIAANFCTLNQAYSPNHKKR